MGSKKEVQKKIIGSSLIGEKVSEDEFLGILRMVAPGTHIRSALDGTLKGRKGALIAIENEHLKGIIDGGFRINARFTPQRLIELSKMDGAIILSKDMKKINYANVLLTPDSRIKTNETGTRHKAAERTAKQTGTLVIAISERRNEITIYYKRKRYPLISTDELLRKTNENIQILEKQKDGFIEHLEKLNKLELRNNNGLKQAISVIQKGIMIKKLKEDLTKNIIELGKEGALLKTRLKEITFGVEKELNYVIKDYSLVDVKKTRAALESLNYDELLNKDKILKVLAYDGAEQQVLRGWRLLSKLPISDAEVAQVVKETGSLGKAIHGNKLVYHTLFEKEKADLIINEINKLKMSL